MSTFVELLTQILSFRIFSSLKLGQNQNLIIMNAQSIGESAKAIWHLLHGDNRKWEYQELKKATGLRDRELNAAIGWLACEGKIQFDESMQGQNTALYIELSYYIG